MKFLDGRAVFKLKMFDTPSSSQKKTDDRTLCRDGWNCSVSHIQLFA